MGQQPLIFLRWTGLQRFLLIFCALHYLTSHLIFLSCSKFGKLLFAEIFHCFILCRDIRQFPESGVFLITRQKIWLCLISSPSSHISNLRFFPSQFCQLVCWSNFMSQEDKLGNDDHLFLIERNSLMIQMVCLRLLKKVDRYWKTMQIIFIAGIAFDVNCCLMNLDHISFPMD